VKNRPGSFPDISYGDWRRLVEEQLGETDFEAAVGSRLAGIDLEPLYTANHPETRGNVESPVATAEIRSSVSADLPWVRCQRFSLRDLEELNQRLKSDLENGVEGVWLSAPTDLEAAFRGVPDLWRVLLIDAGGRFAQAAEALFEWLEESVPDAKDRTFLLGVDPLGTLARNGSLPGSMDDLERALVSVVRRRQAELPRGRAIMVSSEPYREAGAEIDQELAISLAGATHYLRVMEKQSLAPAAAAAEVAFVACTGQEMFLEIAKLRALRVLWRHLQSTCGVSDPSPAWIQTTVLRRSLPRRDSWLNLLRVTTASLAGVVGGADSIETPEFDCGDPDGGTERGRRLARNTQSILGFEAHLGRVLDPACGSYFLESLTQDLVSRGWRLFQEIERRGGLLEALTSGWIQERIAKRWRERYRQIEQGEIGLTGVNVYRSGDEAPPSPRPERSMIPVAAGASSPLVEPLVPHRDSEPCEKDGAAS